MKIAKLFAFPVALLIVGMNMAYNEQQTEENIRKEKMERVAKESIYILHYTIKQDSPGLEKGYEPNPIPLTSPVKAKK